MNKFITTAVMALAFSSPALADEPMWSAADEYWDKEEMDASRTAVVEGNGAMNFLFVKFDKFEYQTGSKGAQLKWDIDSWYGGDKNKLWIKTEGEYSFDRTQFEHSEIQALLSRSISPYFDIQFGIKHDITPNPSTTHGVIGLHGLAPFWFEVDAALFISEHGDISSKIKAEYDLFLSQKLVLQPKAEVTFNFQDMADIHEGSGLTKLKTGLRLRYATTLKFAPYIGINWERKLGGTAQLARDDGENPSKLHFVTGIKAWF